MSSTKAPVWPGARPVKTCTECKQSKLRCDSRQKYPHDCTRCQAKGLSCRVDPTFQRTPARKRYEAMSKELQELRHQRSYVMTPSRSPPATDDSGGASQNSPESHHQYATPSVDESADDFDMDMMQLSLNGVPVNTEAAIRAFRIFAQLYRPQLPILGPISMRAMYSSSPFLFWTIVVIVVSHVCDSPIFKSGRNPDDELYFELREPYLDLLRRECLVVPSSVSHVQALVYLCHWPLPLRRQAEDPSWLYCGLATNAATSISLHRPNVVAHSGGPGSRWPPPHQPVQRPARLGTAQSRLATWLGVFYVSTSLSMHLGLPPPVNSDQDIATVTSYLEDPGVPRDFAARLRILLIVARYTNVLSHGVSETVDSSLIRLFDAELDALKSGLGPLLTHETEYMILDVKLHFYAMFLARSSSAATAAAAAANAGAGAGSASSAAAGILGAASASSSSRDILLKMVLATAIRAIHVSSLRLRYNTDTSTSTTTNTTTTTTTTTTSGAPTPDDPTAQSTTTEDSQQHSLTLPQLRRTLPKDYFRALAFATVLLLRYFSLNRSAPPEERQQAAHHVSLAHAQFRATSGDGNGNGGGGEDGKGAGGGGPTYDEHERAAAFLEALGRAKPYSSDEQAGRLRCSDRMGVSILVDSVWTANELRYNTREGGGWERHRDMLEASAAARTEGDQVRQGMATTRDGEAVEQQQQQQRQFQDGVGEIQQDATTAGGDDAMMGVMQQPGNENANAQMMMMMAQQQQQFGEPPFYMDQFPQELMMEDPMLATWFDWGNVNAPYQ